MKYSIVAMPELTYKIGIVRLQLLLEVKIYQDNSPNDFVRETIPSSLTRGGSNTIYTTPGR